MKKVFMLAAMVIAFTGFTMAQASPKAKEPVKKEATAPVKEVAKNDKTKKAAGAHHHKKHTKHPKQS